MPIKERPLIKAVERLGPLPGFLFSNMIFAGFFTMFMSAVFGAVFMTFWSLFGKSQEVYEAARFGAIGAVAFASLIFIGILISAFREPDERNVRLQFFIGGALCLVLLITVDVLTADIIREYLFEGGLLICTSQTPGCD
jgi:hypothetical protein